MFCAKEICISFETAWDKDHVRRYSPAKVHVRQKGQFKHETCICSCEKKNSAPIKIEPQLFSRMIAILLLSDEIALW